jgi:hypothetical protein
MPVIPVNRVVDPKRIIRKMEDQGGGEAQGVADPPKNVHNGGYKFIIKTFKVKCSSI